MLDELQRDRDKLCAEVKMLKAKDAMRDHRCKVSISLLLLLHAALIFDVNL